MVDVSTASELSSTDVAVIREVYDGDNAQDLFEIELEKALQAGCKSIVIEPSALGDETARWIYVGNCLYNMTIISGMGAFLSGLALPQKPLLSLPFGITSVFCASLYNISWQFDPCCQYQVEENKRRRSTSSHRAAGRHRSTGSTSTPPPVRRKSIAEGSASVNPCPVILIKQPNTQVPRRVILQSVMAVSAFAFSIWRVSGVNTVFAAAAANAMAD